MASSAFKSTTRRDLHASSSATTTTSRSDPPPCPRRSRSVSAAPRARGHHDILLQAQEDYANTRTNPLFDSAASASPPQQHPARTATSAGGGDAPRPPDRGRQPLKGGGRGGGGGGGRARSVSVAPQRRHTASAQSADGAGAVGGRRASRARSVADEVRPYRCSETDTEARKLQSWRSRHSISEAIWQQNHSTVPVDPVLEIPPEFDPDSAEFISDLSDYATVGCVHPWM